MAYATSQLVASSPADDRFLLLLGVGHMAYSVRRRTNHARQLCVTLTQPNERHAAARALAHLLELGAQSFAIYCRGVEHGLSLSRLEPHDTVDELGRLFGPRAAHAPIAADVCFAFEEVEEAVEQVAAAAEGAESGSAEGAAEGAARVKADTASAYDAVGETAHVAGNLAKAHAVMARLRYTPQQIEIAGADACARPPAAGPKRRTGRPFALHVAPRHWPAY
eukprot:586123-Prymnesium_polylepis.1